MFGADHKETEFRTVSAAVVEREEDLRRDLYREVAVEYGFEHIGRIESHFDCEGIKAVVCLIHTGKERAEDLSELLVGVFDRFVHTALFLEQFYPVVQGLVLSLPVVDDVLVKNGSAGGVAEHGGGITMSLLS